MTAGLINRFTAANRFSFLSPRYKLNALFFIRPESRIDLRRTELERPAPPGDPERRVRDGDADSGAGDPPPPRGPRCARPGADRHREDRGVRHPHAPGHRPGTESPAGP